MSNFDIDSYLKSRYEADTKLDQIANAADTKKAEFAARLPAPKAPESWSDKLGLDAGGFASNRVNDAASLVSGASRLAGQVAGIVPSVAGAFDMDPVNAGDVDAYNRAKTGVATPEDLERLDRIPQPGSPSVLERIESGTKNRERARGVSEAFNLEGIVDQTNRKALTEDISSDFKPAFDKLKSGWDNGNVGEMAAGVGSLLYNAGDAVVRNPAGVREFIIENLPQLAVGAVGKAGQAVMTASNVGYAMDTYQKGIEEYAKANGGQLPPDEVRGRMATQAATLALAEQAGDVATLGASKMSKVFSKAEDQVDKVLEKTGLLQGVKNVVKATGQGTASEAPTEAYQTYMEGEITGKPATAEEVYTGAVIGGASGGALAGGGRAVSETLSPSGEAKAKDALAPKQDKKAVDAAFEAGISSGDVSGLTDPTKADTYAPERAVAALYAHAKMDTTAPEAKAKSLEQAQEITGSLEKQATELSNRLGDLPQSAEEVAEIKEDIAAYKKALENPGPGVNVAAVERIIGLYEQRVADFGLGKSVQDQMAQEAETLSRRASLARKSLDSFLKEDLNKGIAPQDTVAQATAKVDPADTVATEAKAVAAKQTINLSMASSEVLTEAQATQMADDQDNGLAAPERSYLKAFATARAAETAALKVHDVTKQVLFGGKGNVGIAQYRERIGSALNTGSQKDADYQLEQITKFRNDHQAKTEAALKAGVGGQIRKVNGKWTVLKERIDHSKVTAGGLGYTLNGTTLIRAFSAETDALNAAVSEFEAAIAAKFSQPAQPKKEANVKNEASPQRNQAKPSTKTDEKVQAPASNGEAKVQGDSGVKGSGRDGNVEADGVDLGSREFKDLTDPDEKIALYRGEGTGNIQDGAWWSFDKADAEKYAEANNGKVVRRVMTAKEIGAKTAQGQIGPRHRVFPDKADVGIVNEETQAKKPDAKVVPADESRAESKKDEEAKAEPVTKEEPVDETVNEVESSPVEEPGLDEPVQVQTGTLDALSTKDAADVPYIARNLVADFVSQVEMREGDKTGRPLVAVKNFMSEVRSGARKIADFVTLTGEAKEKEAINAFSKFSREMDTVFTSQLAERANRDFWHTDVMQYLIKNEDGNLSLEENIKTAMSFAAATYLADNASGNGWETAKDINKKLGKKNKKAPVSPKAWALVGRAGPYQHIVIDKVGSAAFDALGLKVSKDAPLDFEPKLRAALGSHILVAMERAGYVKRTTHSAAVMAELRGKQDADVVAVENSFVEHNFFAVNRNKDGALTAEVKKITDALSGSKSVLNKLFKTTPDKESPSLTPIADVDATVANSTQPAPQALVEIVKVMQARPRKIRKDVMRLFSKITNESVVKDMMGIREVTEENTHVTEVLNQQAKMDALEREWQTFQDFLAELTDTENGMDTEFFLKHSIWKNHRVGISSSINPQASKIHRYLISGAAWESEVQMNDLESFKLRVAEGLKIKTEQAQVATSIAKMEAIMAGPEMVAAVAAIQKAKDGDLSAEEQQAIATAVRKSKTNMHGLDVLMAWAEYQTAVANEATSFKTNITAEVDGVANGTMFNHVLLGAGYDPVSFAARAAQGGFFLGKKAKDENGKDVFVPEKFTQYNEYRGTTGNLDVYEEAARTTVELVREIPPKHKDAVAAIWAIKGDILNAAQEITSTGRSLIKDAMNPLAFGSAFPAIDVGLSDAFMESIIEKMTEMALDDTVTQEAVDAFMGQIDVLLESGGAKANGLSIPRNELLTTEFTKEEEAALRKAFSQTIGTAVVQTLESEFATFIAQRDALNLSAQASFEIYNAVAQGMKDAFIAEAFEKGELPLNAKGERAADITSEQQAEIDKALKEVMPIVATAFSQESGNKETGLLEAKTDRIPNADPLYRNGSQFAKGANAGKNSLGTGVLTRARTSPSVAMGSGQIHSFDTQAAHEPQRKHDVTGVHDALIMPIANHTAVAKSLNEATFNALLNYSPLSAQAEAFDDVITGVLGLINSGRMPPHVLKGIDQALLKFGKKKRMEPKSGIAVLAEVHSTINHAAFTADTAKLTLMSKLVSIDQYAAVGGNYAVTDTDRSKAEARLKALPKEASQKSVTNLDALTAEIQEAQGKQAKPAPKKAPVAPVEPVTQAEPEVAQEVDDEIEAYAEPEVQVTPFGTIGNPMTAPDPGLAKFFEANPTTTVGRVLEGLYRRYNAGEARTDQANAKLIKLIRSVVDKDMKVQYVTRDTVPADVAAMPKTTSAGWFISNEAGDTIYVLSGEFEGSNLTPEVLLHELVHAATARTIEVELANKAKNPNYRSHALIAINDLEALRDQAITYIAVNGLKGYDNATENVHELLAWGMSNTDFQRDVLNKLVIPGGSKKSSLTKGMAKFVQAITNILFKGSNKTEQQVMESGLTVLITNASALMAKTNKNNEAKSKINLSMASNPVGAVNTFSTTDIHNALSAGTISSNFDEKLVGLLNGVVTALHGPFGSFKAGLMKDQAITAHDVWLKALATGVVPTNYSSATAPIVSSEREAFVMDQVEAVVREATKTTPEAYKALKKLYHEARKTLTVADFNSQDEYDFIFNPVANADGTSDYLARFAAFGLANESFNAKLDFKTSVAEAGWLEGKTFAEKMQNLFEKILGIFNRKVTGIYKGQAANQQLTKLVEQLVDIEAKSRGVIAKTAWQANMDAASAVGSKAIDAGRKAVVSVLKWPVFKANKSPIVRASASLASTIVEDRTKHLVEALTEFGEKHRIGRHNLTLDIFAELRGPGEIYSRLLRATKLNEGNRKDIKTNTAGSMLSGFLETSKVKSADKNVARQARAAITDVFMRSGMHALNGVYTLGQIEALLGDKAALKVEIDKLEASLQQFAKLSPNGNLPVYFMNQAAALGAYKATEQVSMDFMMLNAHNIARLGGTSGQNLITEEDALKAEPIIEQLIALRTLHYTDNAIQLEAKEILQAENNRTDGENGVQFVLNVHKHLEKDALERVFGGNKTLMQHGYTPDIFNPHTEVQAADSYEGARLVEAGWSKLYDLPADPMDPRGEQRALYTLKGAGSPRYQSGIMSLTGLAAFGSKVHGDYMNVNTAEGAQNAADKAAIDANKQAGIRTMMSNKVDRDNLNKLDYNRTIPVMNEMGDVANYRYAMRKSTKDAVLERNNDFSEIMGTIAAGTYDKETGPVQNATAIKALKAVKDLEFAKSPDLFYEIGPKSPDPEMRELWALLPDATRKEIRSVFGNDKIQVRKDSMNIVFGYRKISAASIFTRSNEQKERKALGMGKHYQDINAVQQIVVDSLEAVLSTYARYGKNLSQADAEKYAKQAAMKVTRAERMWQEVMSETKDLIVIKSISVFMGNVRSNLSQLVLYGINPVQMVRSHRIALKGATAWMNDSKELEFYKLQLESGSAQDVNEAKANIVRLEDSMKRNPVRDLIEAGLMPTIVEDVEADADEYSYKSALVRKVGDLTSKVNPTVVAAAKQVYMAKNTAMYKSLHRATQLSDFVARYTLYQHLTTKQDPLSKQAAIDEASDAFVNYDIPMPRSMQYMDDMGLIMFTKYFLRIQRVLMKMGKDHPGKVLGMLALDNYLNLGPIVLDGAAVGHIGNNPFTMGPLQYLGSLDELATVSAAMAVVK